MNPHPSDSPPPTPFARSYWAAPGVLLAGCYPGDADPAKATEKLIGLVRCGVGRVINLMHEDEVNYAGQPFADYRPALQGLAVEAGRTIGYERLPIRDNDVPSVAYMTTILDTISAANAAGQIVYVHCWGGKGRTGTVVGCYLVRRRIATGDEALRRLNELAKTSLYDFGTVPQTAAQCAFVGDWRPGQ